MSADDVYLEAADKMEKAVGALEHQLRTIRTGRASASLVDHIRVEYYGAQTPLGPDREHRHARPGAHRHPPLRSDGAQGDREGDHAVGHGREPEQRRQADPHRDSAAERRAPPAARLPGQADGRTGQGGHPQHPPRRQARYREDSKRTARFRRTSRSRPSRTSRNSPRSPRARRMRSSNGSQRKS